jgi:hypothetical protein
LQLGCRPTGVDFNSSSHFTSIIRQCSHDFHPIFRCSAPPSAASGKAALWQRERSYLAKQRHLSQSDTSEAPTGAPPLPRPSAAWTPPLRNIPTQEPIRCHLFGIFPPRSQSDVTSSEYSHPGANQMAPLRNIPTQEPIRCHLLRIFPPKSQSDVTSSEYSHPGANQMSPLRNIPTQEPIKCHLVGTFPPRSQSDPPRRHSGKATPSEIHRGAWSLGFRV